MDHIIDTLKFENHRNATISMPNTGGGQILLRKNNRSES